MDRISGFEPEDGSSILSGGTFLYPMPKRVVIVHGWDGFPEEGWFPWLKRELESHNFIVDVPQMPAPDEPRINNWVPKLKEVVRTPNEDTYFVGHSMGCQTIARYLESLRNNVEVGGAVFVAGFFKRLTNLEDDDVVHDVAKEWLTAPIDLNKVRQHLKKSVAIFSDNDPYVPIDNQEDFKTKLGCRIIIEHSLGHFSGQTGTTSLPIVFNTLLDLSKKIMLN